MDDFEEYERLGEPGKREKSSIWQTAIGLQGVDGLKPSAYLIETAKQNIEGAITFDEVKRRLDSYYEAKPVGMGGDDRTEEADKVSAHIAEVLSEKTFTFSPAEYITIHKRLFQGVYKFAGKIRDYNISKPEWVLNGETVYYAGADTIRATLDYDFAQEKAFSYKGLTKKQMVAHIATFISNLWQIHAFGEGNTRTTAVFTIKYLRAFGFTATNDLFAKHSWYFRNALVRANYNDHRNSVYSTTEYLDRFFGNLLFGENNTLRNRELHVKGGEYDIVKQRVDTVNDVASLQYDAVNYKDDTVKRRNDTVKSKNDTVRPRADAVNRAIVELIRDSPRTTAEMMAENLGIGIATVKRHIKILKDGGVVDRVGSDKTGYWKIRKASCADK